MSTTQIALAAWGAGTIAVVLACVVWLQWFRRNLNHVAFADQIARLCHANNVERAIKLCSVAPNVPMAAAVRKCLEAVNVGQDEPASETTARLRDIYNTSMKADLGAGQRAFYLGGIVIADIALGSYLVVSRHASRGPLALYVFALLVLANAWVMARRIATQSAVQGERLFPIMAASRR